MPRVVDPFRATHDYASGETTRTTHARGRSRPTRGAGPTRQSVYGAREARRHEWAAPSLPEHLFLPQGYLHRRARAVRSGDTGLRALCALQHGCGRNVGRAGLRDSLRRAHEAP